MTTVPEPTVAQLYPDAPQKRLCGILFVQVPCGTCPELIWTSAGHCSVNCRDHRKERGLSAFATPHLIIPRSEGTFHGTRPAGWAC